MRQWQGEIASELSDIRRYRLRWRTRYEEKSGKPDTLRLADASIGVKIDSPWKLERFFDAVGFNA